MLIRIPGVFSLIVRNKDENITEINIMIENIMMTTIPYYLRTKGLLYIFLASANMYIKRVYLKKVSLLNNTAFLIFFRFYNKTYMRRAIDKNAFLSYRFSFNPKKIFISSQK